MHCPNWRLSLRRNAPTILLMVAAVCMSMLVPETALAQNKLPYEAGLDDLRYSMIGPVPFMISLVGIIGCGAMLIFGGEISGFMRTMVFIVLVVAVIVQASSLIGMLGGSFDGKPIAAGNSSIVGRQAV